MSCPSTPRVRHTFLPDSAFAPGHDARVGAGNSNSDSTGTGTGTGNVNSNGNSTGTGAGERTLASGRLRAGELSDLQSLAAWQPGIRGLLDARFDLGELKGRLCVVQCKDASVVLFLLDQYVHSDTADELERLIVQRGFKLGTPSRYRVPAPLLLAVSEQTAGTEARSSWPRERSALAAAFDEIIAAGVRHSASDIHFNVDNRSRHSSIRFSIDGQYLLPPQYRAVPTLTMMDMLAVAWMRVRGGNGAVFDPLIEQQGRLSLVVDQRTVVLRWASLAADRGPSVCLRLLPGQAASATQGLQELGYLPGQIEAFEQACGSEGGAIVIAGTVGSGKSTTLAALLTRIASHRKLITLEDPVEHVIPDAIQNTLGRELDQDDDTVFDAKLRTIKRSAADDLMIGEIRDVQTGRAFMDLAASGIRVYATTHTSAARLIPERLASDFIGVSRDLMACPGILKLLVYQSLFALLCEHCAVPWQASGGDLSSAQRRHLATLADACGVRTDDMRTRSARGCERCRGAKLPALWGYAGRTVVAEWLAPSQDTQLLAGIRSRDHAALAQWLATRDRSPDPADTRFWTVRDSAMHKLAAGVLDVREVLARFAPGARPEGHPVHAGRFVHE